MMSASDAARKSNEVIKRHETEELKKIDELIERKAMFGQRYASYDGTISENARAELERLGYKVRLGSQCDVEYVTIEW